MKMMRLKVAVIGAGAAGLAALRHLTARPDKFQAVAYEQTNYVGGTWVYSEKTGMDHNGLPIHSSMYNNLRTNLPKEAMAYNDFPFRKSLPSFLKHDDVKNYLDDYADNFNLWDHIQFYSSVERVHPKSTSGGTTWEVSTENLKQPERQRETKLFDAIIVANGHYSIPILPNIPGMNNFKGEVVHSHNYRHPGDYTDKRVVVLGAGASGQDICLDLASCARQVILSHNKAPLQSHLPSNVQQVPGVVSLTEDGVVFRNGQEEQADALLMCTGYKFNFPFLTPECAVEVCDERVTHLYKHIIHTSHTSLSFIGLCRQVCPFPMFDNQAQFILSTLDGSLKLPTKQEMEQEILEDYKERLNSGMLHRYAHHMGPRQWDYNDSLAEMANFKPISPVVRKLFDEVHYGRVNNLLAYRNKNYNVIDDETFEAVSKQQTA